MPHEKSMSSCLTLNTSTAGFYHLCSAPCTDGTVRLQREVVLLTDDRNLRVKALTRNVPVRDIPAFLSWAKVGWTRTRWNRGNPAAQACLQQTRKGRCREGKKKGSETFHFVLKCAHVYVLRSVSFPRQTHREALEGFSCNWGSIEGKNGEIRFGKCVVQTWASAPS